MSAFSALDSAIAQFEGYGDVQAAPSITNGNNPGALMYSPYVAGLGATGQNPNGTAAFDSLESGLSALHTVEQNIIGAGNNTPQSFIQAYEGNQSGPVVSNYQNSVANSLGIGTGDQIPASATTAGNSSGSGSPVPGIPSNAPSTSPFGSLDSLSLNPFAGIMKSFPSFAQIAFFVIGAGLIIGGIFFLRPVQTVVRDTVSTAKRGAELFV